MPLAFVRLLILPWLKFAIHRPSVHAPEKALDDPEGNETTDVDAELGEGMEAGPGGDGESWAEGGVEAEESRPGGVRVTS